MPKMVVGSLLLFLVVGCGMPYQESLYTDSTLFNTYAHKIKSGKTTEQEIQEWFGEPWMVTKDLQGRPQFVYLFRDERRRMDVVFKDGIVYDHDVIWHGGDGTDRNDTVRQRR